MYAPGFLLPAFVCSSANCSFGRVCTVPRRADGTAECLSVFRGSSFYILFTCEPCPAAFTWRVHGTAWGLLKMTKPPTHQTQAGGACGAHSSEVPPRSPVDLSPLNMNLFDFGVPRLLTEKLLFI